MAVVLAAVLAAAGAAEEDDRGVEAGEEQQEEGLFLPTDRQRQRQLDRAMRLLAERRWSDAATLLDEILASDTDSFHEARARRRVPEPAGDAGSNAAGRAPSADATWKSLKSAADELIGGLDAEGREAYELRFRAKADRSLSQAVGEGSLDGVMSVARRWFHTPAGGRAALLLAVRSLETGQPYAAVAWLDRLAASRHAEDFEPSLSVMRAIAWARAGETERAVATIERAREGKRTDIRIAGRDLKIAYPSGAAEEWLAGIAGNATRSAERHDADWLMPGGNPSRNSRSLGFRPLLAPRYRVSLARHPGEARQLEQHRRAMAEKDIPLLPAGQPLAVSGRLIAHSMLGLLAVDFETGKRLWLQTGPYETGDDIVALDGTASGDDFTPVGDRGFDRVFEDATCGTLSSDGRLVFAVENPRQAYAEPVQPMGVGIPSVNTLSAYEVEGVGRLAWRLTRPSDQPGTVAVGGADGGPAAAGGPAVREPVVREQGGWFLGPPLPVGGQLFALVEEKGGVRLDVLDASSGSPIWSQPLAELDEARAIDKPAARPRRLAGLSPSLGEGVLVCPTGAGAVIGVDIATRSLLWAYRYAQVESAASVLGVQIQGNMLGQGIVVRRGPNGVMIVQGGGDQSMPRNRWLDDTPIIAEGRIVLSPRESNDLHCLDLRSGGLLWKVPRKPNLSVAGVSDGRVVVVGRRSVDAVSLATGERAWPAPLDLGTASPSGRGCLSRGRLFLPLDSPEVVEIDLERPAIVGRSAARGGHAGLAAGGGRNPIPGNLIAYRGEVVSQSATSLDVFHQTEPLEKAVETALSEKARDPWALYWRGQLLLDRGRTADGIAAIESSHGADPRRIPAEVVAGSILFALERDFSAASVLWPHGADLAKERQTRVSILRTAVAGFLAAGKPADGWAAYRRLASEDDTEELVVDPSDASVACVESRWMRGRLQQLLGQRAGMPPASQPSASLRLEIGSAMDAMLDRGLASDDPLAAVQRFLERVDVDPAGPATGRGEHSGRESAAARARRILIERLTSGSSVPASDGFRGTGIARELLLLSILRSDDAAARRLAADQIAARTAVNDGSPAGSPWNDAAAWPVGRVTVVRDERHRGNPQSGQPRLVRFVPVLNAESDSSDLASMGSAEARLGMPGLRLSFDAQAGSALLASDAFGRRLGDPLAFDDGPGRFSPFGAVQSSNFFDATVVGRVAIVRCAGRVAAFELARDGSAAGGANRRLWSMSGPYGTMMGMGGAAMGHRRLGFPGIPVMAGVPLAARFVEPSGNSRQGLASVKVGRATTAGVPIVANQSLELRDVATGSTLWTRHRVDPDDDLLGDGRFLTVVPKDGRGAVVLSMVDGRVERKCDLPPRESRLCGSGRRLVVIEPAADGSRGLMTLVMLDPVAGTRTSLGEFPGDALAAPFSESALAVLDPGGRFTLLDLVDGSTTFSRTLEQMPRGLKGLHVMPWEDRLIVIASRDETPEEQAELDRLGPRTPVHQAWNADETSLIITASIWSIDRASGESLWPMPATVLRHGLQLTQPPGLPLLVLARQVHGRQANERPRLGILCLDKRTGHAVYENDRLPLEPHHLSCEVSGDPSTRQVFIDIGSSRTTLTYEGSPIPPRPPFQAGGSPAGGKDVWREIERWMNRALNSVPF